MQSNRVRVVIVLVVSLLVFGAVYFLSLRQGEMARDRNKVDFYGQSYYYDTFTKTDNALSGQAEKPYAERTSP